MQVAIYIGGDELQKSASTTLRDAPSALKPFKPFKLLSNTFGFDTAGLANRISVHQFESLEPFIDQLDESVFWRILRWIERRGLFLNSGFARYKEEAEKRSKAHQDDKPSRVTRFLQEHFPTDADLLEQLDDCETGGNNAWRWASNCVDYDIEKERISSTLRTWFESNPGVARLKMATEIVEQIGIRTDAEWLQDCQASHGDDSTRVDTEGAVFRVCWSGVENSFNFIGRQDDGLSLLLSWRSQTKRYVAATEFVEGSPNGTQVHGKVRRTCAAINEDFQIISNVFDGDSIWGIAEPRKEASQCGNIVCDVVVGIFPDFHFAFNDGQKLRTVRAAAQN